MSEIVFAGGGSLFRETGQVPLALFEDLFDTVQVVSIVDAPSYRVLLGARRAELEHFSAYSHCIMLYLVETGLGVYICRLLVRDLRVSVMWGTEHMCFVGMRI